MRFKSLFITYFLSIFFVAAAVASDEGVHVYTIPSAAKTGPNADTLQKIYGQGSTVTLVPGNYKDFGGYRSQREFNEAIEQAGKKRGIVHASCAGATTVMRNIADGEQHDEILGILLDGALSAPNAAIQFRTSNVVEKQRLLGSVLLDRIVARGAKTWIGKYVYPQVLFPLGYFATSESPLEAVSKISNKKLPIIIVKQHEEDYAVPYTQSDALYHELRKHNFDNAYLMQPDNNGHVDLINPVGEKAAAIRRIMSGIATEEDKKLYQPSHEQFEPIYNELITHDRAVRTVAKRTNITLAVAATLCVLKLLR